MTKSQEQLNEQAEVAPTIWKYELELEQRQTITMPAGAQVLPTEAPDGNDEERTFEIVGTGHPVPIDGIYLGTALCDVYVWHVYEIIPGISGVSL